jgi:hypothetical protein
MKIRKHNSLLSLDLEVMMTVFEASLCDLASASVYPRSEWKRDIAEMRRRASFEGVGFFTKTLPRLGKALDKALCQGQALQTPGFERYPGSQLPKFLRMLFVRVFDADGWERSDASPDAVRSLRQLLLSLSKYQLPSTYEQENKVIEDFVHTDNALTTSYERRHDPGTKTLDHG